MLQFFTEDRHTNRGGLMIASCDSGSYLARSIVDCYRKRLEAESVEKTIIFLDKIDRHFDDGEIVVRLPENVRGTDVFLVQALANPTSPFSINDNYASFLIALRAFREHGARQVTAVLSYLAYGRQDKPTRFKREPTTARLMADMAIIAGMNQLVTWEPHCHPQALYGSTKVDMLNSLPIFVEHFESFANRPDVIVVAPDRGATELNEDFANPNALNLAYALAAKHRPRPGVAEIGQIIGNFRRKKIAIILDDMIASGGTMLALIKKLVNEKGIEQVYLGVSHNLCLPQAYDRFIELYENYGLQEIFVTNSIPQTEQFLALPFLKVKCLSQILCHTINCIHYNRSVSGLTYNH